MADNKLDVTETAVAENGSETAVKKTPFFKTTIFRCLTTLLCVLLVSGIFLTLMNSLLAVSDAERFDRAINKIYGKSVKTETLSVADYNDNATINEAYLIKDDGNYLIKATGKGGFDNGTVTCWIVVEVKNRSISGIGKVIVDSNKAQSYISNINDRFLACFSSAYTEGEYFSATDDGFIKTGATFSAGAICNAVNGAIDFVNAQFGVIVEDKYEGYLYTSNINTRSTSHVYNAEDNSVTYTVVSKGYGKAGGEFTSKITVNSEGRIKSFEVLIAGSTDQSYTDKAIANANAMSMNKNITELLAILNLGVDSDVVYKDGAYVTSNATNSTFSLHNAAIFAAANAQKIIDENKPADGGEEENPDQTETDGGEVNE